MDNARVLAGVRRVVSVAVVVSCVLSLAGCLGPRGIPRTLQTAEPRRVATRAELVATLKANMAQLTTLKARARMMVIRQDILLPAGRRDELRMIRGKPYQKKFFRTEASGLLLLAHDPLGDRAVSFWGEVSGASGSFRLLGRNESFWLTLPNFERSKEDKEEATGFVYVGKAPREQKRPKDFWSLRPQDVCDLFLQDEVFIPDVIYYMETWPDHYVLTLLRQDWPQHIYSRVWIERRTLRIETHQIFDAMGEILAEARFGRYRPFPLGKSTVKAEVPTLVVLLWPRDKLVMEVALDGIALNEDIPEKKFEPYLPPGYQYKEIRAEDIRRGPAD